VKIEGESGMRISELIQLRWSEVDLVLRMITILDNRHSHRSQQAGAKQTTKSGRTRWVPIHPTLRPVLESLPRHQDGRVFHGPRGGRLKADTVRNVFIREVITSLKAKFPTPPGAIGFEHGRLHSFRHFFVSRAFIEGASEGEIREWVGHRDSRIVERYRHLSNKDARRKMEQLQFFSATSNNKKEVAKASASDAPQGSSKTNTDGSGKESDVPTQRPCHKPGEVQASNQQNEKTRDDDGKRDEAA
jgi:integrase